MYNNLITEELILPSANTRLYGDNFDGHITLRAMTTVEERMLLSSQSFYDRMCSIINNCIVDNKKENGEYKIDSRAFTDFDFFAAMVKLRMISYGNMYKTTATCTKCGHKFIYKADLSKLVYNLVPEDFTEPYEIGPLPKSGDTLGCRFLRIKDRLEIDKQAKLIMANNPNFIGDPKYTLEMQRRIVTVNGNPVDFIQAEDYVTNMIAMDSSIYHDQVDKLDFGCVRLSVIDCENPIGCDGAAYWILGPDNEFFRPCLD